MLEVRIIWKYPPEQFAYLRESIYWTMRSKGPIHGWSGRQGWVKTLEELQKVANVRREMRTEGANMKWAPDAHLMIGYAEVEKTSSWVGYERRYWWLRSYDRDLFPDGIYAKGHPCEAVQPLSIAINCQSKPGASQGLRELEKVSNERRTGVLKLRLLTSKHSGGRENGR